MGLVMAVVLIQAAEPSPGFSRVLVRPSLLAWSSGPGFGCPETGTPKIDDVD